MTTSGTTFEITTEPIDFSDKVEDYQGYRRMRRSDRDKMPFRDRPFLAIDGEGVTHQGDEQQSYVLLGGSTGTQNHQIHSKSLTTVQCLRFLCMMEQQYPTHIKVAFSFNYDVNMIAVDLPPKKLERLISNEWVQWQGHRMRWLKGKWFEVSTDKIYTKIYDIFSFFACSFVKALQQYLGDDAELARIVEGKAERNTFEYSELTEFILPYMQAELHCMVKLCVKLRTLLEKLSVIPRGWHGPGAVSSALLSLHGVNKYRSKRDPHIIEYASSFAYFGGRFEDFKMGLYEKPVYQYDIRSAYPYALTLCPELSTDFEIRKDGEPDDFSLIRYMYADNETDRSRINPLPLRTRNGAIFYPPMVTGVCWGIEYKAAQAFPGQFKLLDWVKFYDSGERPFEFVGELYSQRAQWKREGNPVQLAAKLSMNSIYGKLAQRVGWNREKRLPPQYHQLRWAGFITAVCRAKMLDLIAQAPDRIIAVETDGIYSETPLDCDIGPELGQFELAEHDGILYMQSGVYFTRANGEWQKGKTRGFSPNRTDIDTALRNLKTLDPLCISQTRFQGLPLAINSDKWRSWQTGDRLITWGGNGKRRHLTTHCDACSTGSDWHTTAFSVPHTPFSSPHQIPWRTVENK